MRAVKVVPSATSNAVDIKARVGRWPWDWAKVQTIGVNVPDYEDRLAKAVSQAQTVAMATGAWR